MSERPVARRYDYFEQIGPHRYVSGNAQQINHCRHSDVSGPAAEKSAKHPANERYHQDDPNRYLLNTRCLQLDHRWYFDLMNSPGDVIKSGLVLLDHGHLARLLSPALMAALHL